MKRKIHLHIHRSFPLTKLKPIKFIENAVTDTGTDVDVDAFAVALWHCDVFKFSHLMGDSDEFLIGISH